MGESATRPVFQASGLHVHRGGSLLVENFELQLQRGMRTGLVGPSGSGKTSLLRVLCGLDNPSRGSLELAGQDPEALGWPHFRRRVVFVCAEPVVFETSVLDNVLRPGTYASSSGPFDEDDARDLLTALGLGSKLDALATELSFGERHRVALARAIMVQPDVLLLDEPTTGLDDAAVAALEDTLKECSDRRGTAMLIASHDLAHLGRLCGQEIRISPPEVTV
jgi:putative ABC transport system ATP-binding protein